MDEKAKGTSWYYPSLSTSRPETRRSFTKALVNTSLALLLVGNLFYHWRTDNAHTRSPDVDVNETPQSNDGFDWYKVSQMLSFLPLTISDMQLPELL